MMNTVVQVIPIDTILSIISTFLNKIKLDSQDCDESGWCRNVELTSIAAYQQLVASGTIDPREDVWSVDVGFYNNNIDQIKTIKDLLYDTNIIIDKYQRQTNEDTYPVNPMIQAIHDTLLSILQNQRVLTSATITFTIPNILKHSEGVVDAWQY